MTLSEIPSCWRSWSSLCPLSGAGTYRNGSRPFTEHCRRYELHLSSLSSIILYVCTFLSWSGSFSASSCIKKGHWGVPWSDRYAFVGCCECCDQTDISLWDAVMGAVIRGVCLWGMPWWVLWSDGYVFEGCCEKTDMSLMGGRITAPCYMNW